MSETAFEMVRRILVENLNVEQDIVTLEASLVDDLNADSLDAVELIMALEEELGIEIDPSQAEGITTIHDLVTLIDSINN